MTMLRTLVRAFINFFGITKPTPEMERRATWFIGTLMLAVALLTVASLLAFLHVRR